MTTLAEAVAGLRQRFSAAGLSDAGLDARILTLAAAGLPAAALALRPEEPLPPAAAARLAGYAARRLGGEPVARILGEWEFWGLSFALSPDTLVPRPDTETVVETALRLFPDRNAPLRIADLGTGSGCLLVALLVERPAAAGIGVDRAEGALATARANARRHGVAGRAFLAGSDWGAALAGPFDLVVSNPPYVASGAIASLAPEVRAHDPHPALDGGPDGLDAYRAILADALRLLAPGGRLLVEIGHDQNASVPALAASQGLDVVEAAHDLSGTTRCIALQPGRRPARSGRG